MISITASLLLLKPYVKKSILRIYLTFGKVTLDNNSLTLSSYSFCVQGFRSTIALAYSVLCWIPRSFPDFPVFFLLQTRETRVNSEVRPYVRFDAFPEENLETYFVHVFSYVFFFLKKSNKIRCGTKASENKTKVKCFIIQNFLEKNLVSWTIRTEQTLIL